MAGALLVVALPGAAMWTADAVRHAPARALGWGAALLVLGPLAALLLAATVIGLPFAVVLGGALAAALYLSQVVVGPAFARAILPGSWDIAGRGHNLLAMTLGVGAIGLLRLLPIPLVGTAIAAVVTLLGLGGVARGLHRPPPAVGDWSPPSPLPSPAPGQTSLRQSRGGRRRPVP